MRAETFLANLNERARAAGGLTLDVLAHHVAEALEEISGDAGERTLEDLTNDELREMCAERDLKTSGNKDELVERLEVHERGYVSGPEPTAD